MQLIIMMVILLGLMGCEYGESHEDNPTPAELVFDWQMREAQVTQSKYQKNLALIDANNLFYSIIKNIEYRNDDNDYWQTSDETQNLGTGDCEDIVNLCIVEFIKNGYSDVWATCFYIPTGLYHVMMGITITDGIITGTFYLDAGLSQKESDLESMGYVPVFGYNLNDFWTY